MLASDDLRPRLMIAGVPHEAVVVDDTTRAVLAVRAATRTYGQVQAVADVTLEVRAGEILALVGHNGAGKSTLTRILCGAERPDSGSVEVDGERVAWRSPDDAIARRVLLVPQHLSVAPNLTVRENLLLGPWPAGGSRAATSRHDALASVANEFGIERHLNQQAGALRPAALRHVMIARALLRDPKVLVLDEPTAMLAAPDAEHLFRIVRDLVASGGSVLYITHRLAEVLEIADRVAVMRNGRLTHLRDAAGLGRAELTEWIVGAAEAVPQAAPPKPTPPAHSGVVEVEARAGIEARELASAPKLAPISFTVHAGEVVGVTGLVGSGRTTLLRTLCGVDSATSGQVWVNGRRLRARSPRDAIRAGVAFQPEDRSRNAIIAGMSVASTMALPHPAAFTFSRWLPIVSSARERSAATVVLDRLDVQPRGAARLPLSALSGGNQQKALIGRWLLTDMSVIVLDEPTEGVDVSAKLELYALIRALAADGKAVLFASSDLEEVAALADRVLVLAEGRLVAELRPPHLQVETIARECLAETIREPNPATPGVT